MLLMASFVVAGLGNILPWQYKRDEIQVYVVSGHIEYTGFTVKRRDMLIQ